MNSWSLALCTPNRVNAPEVMITTVSLRSLCHESPQHPHWGRATSPALSYKGTYSHFPGLCVPCKCRRARVSPWPLPLLQAAPGRLCKQLSVCCSQVANWRPIPWVLHRGNAKPCSLIRLGICPPQLESSLSPVYTEQSAVSFLKAVPSASAQRPSRTQPVSTKPKSFQCQTHAVISLSFPPDTLWCTHSAANPLPTNRFQNLSSKLECFLFG